MYTCVHARVCVIYATSTLATMPTYIHLWHSKCAQTFTQTSTVLVGQISVTIEGLALLF